VKPFFFSKSKFCQYYSQVQPAQRAQAMISSYGIFGNERNPGASRFSELFVLECLFVGNSQFLSAFASARRQNPSAISRSHSFAESMLVFSLSLRRLKGTYHID
jgi:hypothetical protein